MISYQMSYGKTNAQPKWTAHITEAGYTYYFNATTNESVWDKPDGFVMPVMFVLLHGTHTHTHTHTYIYIYIYMYNIIYYIILYYIKHNLKFSPHQLLRIL